MKSPSSYVFAFLHKRPSVPSSEMSTVHILAKRILDYFTGIILEVILYSDMYYPPYP